jgi:thiosulfate/3-mercaptopyruvate sulfurtransferase
MKKIKYFSLLLIVFLFAPGGDCPGVFSGRSTDWLHKNLDNPKVIIVDIRKVEDYRAGHIPGAFSMFYGTWAIKKGELDNQLPEDDELIDLLSSAGISPDSIVVVAGTTGSGPDRVNTTRLLDAEIRRVQNRPHPRRGHTKWMGRKNGPCQRRP